jgi:hypothetical protein
MQECQLTSLAVQSTIPPQRFHVGDQVIVTNPEFVTRVGYPMSYQDAFDYVEKNHVQDIEDFLDTKLFKLKSRSELTRFEMSSPVSDKRFGQIMQGMARIYLDSKGHGGKERTIHTVSRPELQGRVFEVLNKKICKTGTYYGPWSQQSYDGEWDGGSGGLDNCKTHVILELSQGFLNFDLGKYSGTWIESCNVRRQDV